MPIATDMQIGFRTILSAIILLFSATFSLLVSPAQAEMDIRENANVLVQGFIGDPRVAALKGERLVIAPFELLNSNEADIPQILQETLTTSFIRTKQFRIIERDQLDLALAELRITNTGLFDPANAKKIGQLLGANYLVLGTISANQDHFAIDARLVALETGVCMAAVYTNADDETQPIGLNTLRKAAEDMVVKLTADQGVAPLAGKRLVIAQFSTPTGKQEWYSPIFQQMVTTAFTRKKQFAVIERSQLEKAIQELHLSNSGMMNMTTAKRLGQMLGADYIVLGTMAQGAQLLVNARIVSIEQGESVAAYGQGESSSTGTASSLRTPVNDAVKALLADPAAAALKGERLVIVDVEGIEDESVLARVNYQITRLMKQQAATANRKAGNADLIERDDTEVAAGEDDDEDWEAPDTDEQPIAKQKKPAAGENPVMAALCKDLQEQLITAVIDAKRYRVVEREKLQEALTELRIQHTGLIRPDDHRKLGKLTGASLMLVGAISQYGGETSIDLRLVSIETGLCVAAASQPIGTAGPVHTAMRKTAGSICQSLVTDPECAWLKGERLVIPECNNSNTGNADSFSLTFYNMLMTEFIRAKFFTIIERTQAESAIQEIQMGKTGLLDPTTCKQLGTMFGASYLLVGDIEVLGYSRATDMRLLAIQDGICIAAAHASVGEPGPEEARVRQIIADLSDAFHTDPDSAELKGQKLAVSQFKNINGNTLTLTKIVQSMLMTEFIQRRHFLVVERSQLEQAVQEMSLANTGLVDQVTAQKAGKMVGANYMLVGSIADLKGNVTFDSRLINIENGESVTAADAAVTVPLHQFGILTGKRCDYGLLGGTAFQVAWSEPLIIDDDDEEEEQPGEPLYYTIRLQEEPPRAFVRFQLSPDSPPMLATCQLFTGFEHYERRILLWQWKDGAFQLLAQSPSLNFEGYAGYRLLAYPIDAQTVLLSMNPGWFITVTITGAKVAFGKLKKDQDNFQVYAADRHLPMQLLASRAVKTSDYYDHVTTQFGRWIYNPKNAGPLFTPAGVFDLSEYWPARDFIDNRCYDYLDDYNNDGMPEVGADDGPVNPDSYYRGDPRYGLLRFRSGKDAPADVIPSLPDMTWWVNQAIPPYLLTYQEPNIIHNAYEGDTLVGEARFTIYQWDGNKYAVIVHFTNKDIGLANDAIVSAIGVCDPKGEGSDGLILISKSGNDKTRITRIIAK